VPLKVIPAQVPTIEAALSGADMVLILTDYTAFKELQWNAKSCPVIDTRDVLNVGAQKGRCIVLGKGKK